jgi:hypothetical protein
VKGSSRQKDGGFRQKTDPEQPFPYEIISEAGGLNFYSSSTRSAASKELK